VVQTKGDFYKFDIMNIIIQTPRFIIRSFEADEEDAYVNLHTDERVTAYIPNRSRDELIIMFRNNLMETPGEITGRWGIFNKADNDFIGSCLLRPFDDGSDSIELGYVLNYSYWGKGIASEMANVLLTRAYKIKQDAKFVAVTTLNNIPSQRVLEKAGMQRCGNYLRNGNELALFKM